MQKKYEQLMISMSSDEQNRGANWNKYVIGELIGIGVQKRIQGGGGGGIRERALVGRRTREVQSLR